MSILTNGKLSEAELFITQAVLSHAVVTDSSIMLKQGLTENGLIITPTLQRSVRTKLEALGSNYLEMPIGMVIEHLIDQQLETEKYMNDKFKEWQTGTEGTFNTALILANQKLAMNVRGLEATIKHLEAIIEKLIRNVPTQSVLELLRNVNFHFLFPTVHETIADTYEDSTEEPK